METVKLEFLEYISNARNTDVGSNMVDVVLLAEGKEFRVHSFILSLRSEYFKAFFQSSLATKVDMAGDIVEDENRNTQKKLGNGSFVPTVIKIDQNPDVLEKILRFLYLDEKCSQFESFEQAKATMLASHEYLLTKYTDICGSYLASQLSSENFVESYNLAVLLKNEVLLESLRNQSIKDPSMFNKMLNLDAFNDYFKAVSKNHLNKLIQTKKSYNRHIKGI